MTTLEVKAIAQDVVAAYDEKLGEPRHTENLDNFKTVFRAQGEVKTWMGKINTGIKIGTIIAGCLVGLPAFIASIITIIRFFKEVK